VSRVCAILRYAKDADFARRHDVHLESPALGRIRFSMGFDTLWKRCRGCLYQEVSEGGDLGLAWNGVPMGVGFVGGGSSTICSIRFVHWNWKQRWISVCDLVHHKDQEAGFSENIIVLVIPGLEQQELDFVRMNCTIV
jgi:hypothetical protein